MGRPVIIGICGRSEDVTATSVAFGAQRRKVTRLSESCSTEVNWPQGNIRAIICSREGIVPGLNPGGAEGGAAVCATADTDPSRNSVIKPAHDALREAILANFM